MRRAPCTGLVLLALMLGCGETGGSFVELPFAGQGTPPETFVKGGWAVTLTEATLGFGPIFFCATASAQSSRCEVAVLEYLDGVTLDGLDENRQPIGALSGTTGTVRTAFFDYGIVWLLTRPLPEALAGVPGGPAVVRSQSSSYVPVGHSGRFVGTAVCIDTPETCCPDADDCPTSYTFEANVDVLVANAGTPAVNGARTEQEITTGPLSLTMRFDPNAWWETVDFARLAALDDGSGEVLLSPSDPDYSAIVAAMTANALPTFSWSSATRE